MSRQKSCHIGWVVLIMCALLVPFSRTAGAETAATPDPAGAGEVHGEAGSFAEATQAADPTAPVPPSTAQEDAPIVVQPQPPVIALPTCVDGVLTLGSISFLPAEGIDYPDEPISLEPDATYVIEARLEPGYTWSVPLTGGWTLAPDGDAEFSITQAFPDCTAVTLPAPVVVLPRCENGILIPGSITIAEVKGITIPDIDSLPQLLPDITLRIEARVDQYYELALPLTDGWAITADNQLAYTLVTGPLDCGTPGPEDPPTETPATNPATEVPAAEPTAPAPATRAPATVHTMVTSLPDTGGPSPTDTTTGLLLLFLGCVTCGATALALRHRRI